MPQPSPFSLSWKEVKGSQDDDLIVCFTETHSSITITTVTHQAKKAVPGSLHLRLIRKLKSWRVLPTPLYHFCLYKPYNLARKQGAFETVNISHLLGWCPLTTNLSLLQTLKFLLLWIHCPSSTWTWLWQYFEVWVNMLTRDWWSGASVSSNSSCSAVRSFPIILNDLVKWCGFR